MDPMLLEELKRLEEGPDGTNEYLPVILECKERSKISSVRQKILDRKGVVTYESKFTNTIGAKIKLKDIKGLSEDEDVVKVWSDFKVRTMLDDSVPLIGADRLWQEGYNGSGIKVAVLDTGIDKTHPELRGKVVAEGSFITKELYGVEEGPEDLFGHGTHCAGIIAGSGTTNVTYTQPPIGAYSGLHVWFSGAGNDPNNTLDHSFNLTGVDSANLSFYTTYTSEYWYDFGYLKVSTDGGVNWTVLDIYGGYSEPKWQEKIYNLTPFVGNDTIIRFEYVSEDRSIESEWYIDDIELSEIGFFDDVEDGSLDWGSEGWAIVEVTNESLICTGVAPGAELLNCKVLNKDGYGYESTVMAGIEWAVDNGADVISMSLGGYVWPPDGNDPLSRTADAAVEQGVVVIAAAGNSGGIFTVGSPALGKNVISVGATTKEDTIAAYSSKGPSWDFRLKPEISAPGGDIIMSNPADEGIVSLNVPGSVIDTWYPERRLGKYHIALSGTSMACPHAAGLSALLLQKNPDWTPKEVKSALMNNARDLGYNPTAQGAGRLDAIASTNAQLLISPTDWTEILNPGEKSRRVFEFSDTGEETLKVKIVPEGDIATWVELRNSLTITPSRDRKVIARLNVPSEPNKVTSGAISVYSTETGEVISSIPVMIGVPLKFDTGGYFRVVNTMECTPDRWGGYIGEDFTYINIPADTPGITVKITLPEDTYMGAYLIDESGLFMTGDWSDKELILSLSYPEPGRYILLTESYGPNSEVIEYTVEAQLNTLTVSPDSWIVGDIPAAEYTQQTFEIRNLGMQDTSVRVDQYIEIPKTEGSFSGDVLPEIWNMGPEPIPGEVDTHVIEVAEDTSKLILKASANSEAEWWFTSIVLYDSEGNHVTWLWLDDWQPTSEVTVRDPIQGTWTVEIYGEYTEPEGLPVNYSCEYISYTKDRSWISFDRSEFVVRGPSRINPEESLVDVFATITPPENVNGDYDGKVIITGATKLDQVIEIPVSVSVAEAIEIPGTYSGEVSNGEWKYFSFDLPDPNSLNATLNWDNSVNDLDLFLLDADGKTVSSSTDQEGTSEYIGVKGLPRGRFTIAVYGYEIGTADTQGFSGKIEIGL